jgi:hypothetical protein
LALPWCFLKDPLYDGRANTQLFADSEDAVPHISERKDLSLDRRLHAAPA